jgi:hypothetical protein
LFSGRKSEKDFLMKDVRKDRIPKDTSQMKHIYYDLKFEEKFGIPLRSQTIFCTSNFITAKVYGNAYYIFPIDKYEIY